VSSQIKVGLVLSDLLKRLWCWNYCPHFYSPWTARFTNCQ